MRLEESKEAFLSLLEREEPLDRTIRLRFYMEMSCAETASGVVDCVTTFLPALYRTYGSEVLDLIRNTLSPTVWEAHNVLINPLMIPSNEGKYIVIADGSVETIQAANIKAHYYGDVRLKVSEGIASVLDTPYPVLAEDQADVYAYGMTKVVANKGALVVLNDRAQAETNESAKIIAYDRSYVEVQGGNPYIDMDDQSRLLVKAGEPAIRLDNHARGVVLEDNSRQKPMDIWLMDRCLLYLENKADAHVEKRGFQGLLIEGPRTDLSAKEVIDLILPSVQKVGPKQLRPRAVPLDLVELKRAVTPLLTDKECTTLLTEVEEAKSELDVLDVLAPELPLLVEKGLTGAFLNAHFTKESLDVWHLHTGCEPSGRVNDLDLGCVNSFLSDQLIYASEYDQTTMVYDHGLVIADNPSQFTYVSGQASAIAIGQCELEVNGHAQAMTLDHSTARSHDQASVKLLDHSTGIANGESFMEVGGEALAYGYDQSRLYFTGKSQGVLEDACRALVLDCEKVLARGDSEVGVYTAERTTELNVQIESDRVKVQELDSKERLVRYRDALIKDETEGEKKSLGVGWS